MTFRVAVPILFRHCDPAGIVFYPRYFEIINDTVEAFFAHLGDPFPAMHAGGRGMPTADIHVTFEAPSRHGDILDVGLRVTRVGGASLGLDVTGTCAGAARFRGESVLVHICKGRALRWSDPLRAALTAERGPLPLQKDTA